MTRWRTLTARLVFVLGFATTATVLGATEASAAGPCDALGWQEITSSGRPIRNVSTLAGPASDGRVFAGSRQGSENITLFSGFPIAEQWQAETAFSGLPVTDVLVTAGRPTEVWVSTFGAPPSYDGPVLGRGPGELFAPRGTLQSWFMSLAASPTDVFVAASKPTDRGVFRWDETSGDWTRLGGADIDTVTFHTLETGGDGRLWLGTDARGLWRSEDGGATWLRVGEDGLTVWSAAVAPDRPDLVLAGLGPPDAGASVAGYPRGIRVSPDGGASWVEVAQPELRVADIVSALAFGATDTSRVFASGYNEGLFVSRDRGVTWLPLPVPVEQQRFYDALHVLRATEACELLLAGSADGLWARNLTPPVAATIYLPLSLRDASPRSG